MSVTSPTFPIGSGSPVTYGNKRWYWDGALGGEPVFSGSVGGATTGTAGDRNAMILPNQTIFNAGLALGWNVIGTQTITAPTRSALGLEIGMDQTDNDGIEITGPILGGGMNFTVGTDLAFGFKCTVKIADVSGADPFMIGFRKQASHAADWNDYTDGAWIGINGTAGDIKIATILNNAATTTTDTTDNAADATAVSFTVLVSAAGVVTYKINDAAPTVTAAFTFDSGDVLIPSIIFVHGTDVAGTVEISFIDIGLNGGQF